MIRTIPLAIMATLALAPGARAQCSCAVNQVTNDPTNLAAQNLSSALSGNTVCVAKSGGGWENQEYHQGGPSTGNVIDYKRGPADPIDPTKALGTWAISGTGTSTTVTYSYSGGSTGQYAVCSLNSQPGPGSTIGYCANNISRASFSATLQAGPSACH